MVPQGLRTALGGVVGLLLLVAVAVSVAACGDADDVGDATEAAPATVATTSTTVVHEVDTTEPPDGDDAALGAGGGDPGSEWCRIQPSVHDGLVALQGDPVGFVNEENVTRLHDDIAAIMEVAPPEVRPAAQVIADWYDAFAEVLARYDYDLAVVPPSELAAATTDAAASNEAAAEIRAFNAEVCGHADDG
ncbi:MAG: hypothetical protein AAFZ07_04120 [Actinomycetota bacterium]